MRVSWTIIVPGPRRLGRRRGTSWYILPGLSLFAKVFDLESGRIRVRRCSFIQIIVCFKNWEHFASCDLKSIAQSWWTCQKGPWPGHLCHCAPPKIPKKSVQSKKSNIHLSFIFPTNKFFLKKSSKMSSILPWLRFRVDNRKHISIAIPWRAKIYRSIHGIRGSPVLLKKVNFAVQFIAR